ncbi:MAG: murein L,D-transpeptidase [Pyrinomonadaceae bacterium]|nr:murein L,D-transpeptidase [Blastocatellia bacterium]MCW5957381.1 murein L,D-transpeptidase [Pyrinomonadaceae bacterium]
MVKAVDSLKYFLFAVVLLCTPMLASAQPLNRNELLSAEQRLTDLGYWLQKVDGIVDASTRHAVTAFQKVTGRKRTGTLSRSDLVVLNTAGPPEPRFLADKAHIEIDITRQVLFLFGESGTIRKILPVSSGNEKRYFDQGKWQVAHTPRGTFRVVSKINGVRHAPLGTLYYPLYFYGGVAIHGSDSVPAFPASHGCVRIPRFADREFNRMVPLGTPVLVYD